MVDNLTKILLEKENIEINFWKNSEIEGPYSNNLWNIANKFSEAKNLIRKLEKADIKSIFESSHSILEIGGGQCWASCIIKNLFPQKKVIASDISEYAIASTHKWEHILGVTLDESLICKSYEIPLPDNSIDLVFCFASAHHFRAHKKTLLEIYRILSKTGTCLYLYEPSCKSYLYKLAKWRVNRKRPDVPEDVLIYNKIINIAHSIGFSVDLQFDRSYLNRGLIEQNYYFLLSRLTFLSHILPCTIDYIFRK